MDNSTIVFLINDDVRAIRGEYENSEETGRTVPSALFKTFDQSIKVGDLVVVESDTRHNMTVVKVCEVDVEINFDTEKKVKWIVQAIDKDGFKEVLDQEQAAINAVQSAERRRKRDELRKAMFADHEEKLKTLAIANVTDGDDEVTE